jgi:hypothetical protein
MARTVAIVLGAWVAIAIPVGIFLGRMVALASRLPHTRPQKLWTPEPQRGASKARAADTPKLWTPERLRRAA